MAIFTSDGERLASPALADLLDRYEAANQPYVPNEVLSAHVADAEVDSWAGLIYVDRILDVVFFPPNP